MWTHHELKSMQHIFFIVRWKCCPNVKIFKCQFFIFLKNYSSSWYRMAFLCLTTENRLWLFIAFHITWTKNSWVFFFLCHISVRKFGLICNKILLLWENFEPLYPVTWKDGNNLQTHSRYCFPHGRIMQFSIANCNYILTDVSSSNIKS